MFALECEEKDECCNTCGNKYKIVKFDYGQGGCVHTNPEGYVCMAFADEGQAIWMTGIEQDGSGDRCECYVPKKKKKQAGGESS